MKSSGVHERRASASNDISDVSSTTAMERIAIRTQSGQPQSSDEASDGSLSDYGTVEFANTASDNQPLIHKTPEDAGTQVRLSSYLKSKQFYVLLLLSQALALCDTGTNTITTLLANEGTSFPAFQSLCNYILLNLIYTSWTIYKYGLQKWLRLILHDWKKFFLLAFLDVEANYFTVLAYRYTTILSAQLIEFWAIAVVVMVSFVFLRVRYHFMQYAGILICCGGLGMMIASDHITGLNGGRAVDVVKGDLFCLLGATFYGLDNVLEEFLVSKMPVYEVVGQLAFWGTLINGAQAAVFERHSLRTATWNANVGSLLTGYTLTLTFFYSVAPLVLRMASAAFFNIGLLTGNFWGLLIGLKLFHLHVHWMYPVAFVLIISGHFVYHGTEGVLGEAHKPWLGENQEEGHDGIGTARRKIEHPNAVV